MPKPLDKNLINNAINYYIENEISIKKCAKKFNMGQTTLGRLLKKNNISIRKINTKIHSYNEDYFELIDTENKAYWLGFIAADGCINCNNLEIGLAHKDKNHLIKFIKDIDGDLPMLKEDIKGKYKKAKVRVCSMKMVRDLNNLGIMPRKSKDYNNFPKIDEKLISHFLRGYFEGDGSISTNGKYRNNAPKYGLNLIATKEFLKEWENHLEKELNITKVKIQTR